MAALVLLLSGIVYWKASFKEDSKIKINMTGRCEAPKKGHCGESGSGSKESWHVIPVTVHWGR